MNDITTITKVKYDRKYKCPYCNMKNTKERLVSHVEKEHSDMLSDTYTAARAVYNSIHNCTDGHCVVCKRPTAWNEKTWKYNRLCGNPSCKKRLSDMADENMKRKYGTTTLLNDPEQQEKMMFNRSISGKYKFKDGGVFPYVGSYELKTLEFLDKVLEIDSFDLMVPGPVVDYKFEDKYLKYIPDMYYIPYNLVIEVKDGGSNPNNRDMESYRKKTLAKENAIKKQGRYNYIRLTNNEFDQLLSIFMELKYAMTMTADEDKIIRVHEEVGGLPRSSDFNVGYIVPYTMSNSFDPIPSYAISRDLDTEKLLYVDKDSKVKAANAKEFLKDKKYGVIKCKRDKKFNEMYLSMLQKAESGESINEDAVPVPYLFMEEDPIDNIYAKFAVDSIVESGLLETVTQSLKLQCNANRNVFTMLPIITPQELSKRDKVLEGYEGLDIACDPAGYFIYNKEKTVRSVSCYTIEECAEYIDTVRFLIEGGIV